MLDSMRDMKQWKEWYSDFENNSFLMVRKSGMIIALNSNATEKLWRAPIKLIVHRMAEKKNSLIGINNFWSKTYNFKKRLKVKYTKNK